MPETRKPEKRKSPKSRLIGIGVDLVSLSRFEKFYRQHRASAAALLAPGKKNSRVTCVSLAKAFAAKEAFFKCLNRSWMGQEGFESIQIKGSQTSRFHVKSPFLPSNAQADGVFFEGEGWVGAQVVVWT